MTFLRFNTITLICLFIHYCGRAQVCEDSVQSYSLYSSYKIEHIGGSFLQLQNGYTANTALVHTPAGRKLCIILTDRDGLFVRAKYIELADPAYTINLANIIEAPGNNLIVYGRLLTASGNEKGVVVIKFDINLALQWSTLFRRSITEPESASYNIWGLSCDDQSNIYFSFYSIPGGTVIPPTVFFISLDAAGALRWSKGIDDRVLPSTTFAFNASTTIDNKTFFIGNYQSGSKPGLIALSVDRNTGAFIKMSSAALNTSGTVAISYQDQNIRLWPGSRDMYYAFGEDISAPKQSNIIHVLIDTSFTIKRARRFKGMMWAYSWRQFNLGKDGLISFLGHDDPIATGISTDHFAVVDSSGNTLISKKIGNNFFTMPDLFPAIISQDGQRLSLSASNRNVLDSVKRISLPLDGDTSLYSCLGKDTAFFSLENTTLTKTDINPGTVYSNIVQLSSLALQLSDFTAQKQEFCKVKSICSSLQVSGKSLFCTGDPQVFIARKNAGCLKKISWQLDGVPASLLNQTDSSITLQFNSNWNGSIVAGLEGCNVTGSLPIDVREPLSPFSLGNDKIICVGDTIVFSAPQGYPIYQWSTGETTSRIKVATPGTFTVQVSDDCGNTYSSSVNVSYPRHISPTISDTIICKGDSVFITLPASISSITWNPSASAIDANSFFVLPVTNTLYSIQAKDENDCPYTSQFTVTVNPCNEQLWLPTAFSPNGDNLNDSFGAVTEGRLRSFSLAVYNRWGQKIFSTANPTKNWDGKMNGTPATAGVYVWMCSYQFMRSSVKSVKGTVVLIR